MAHLFLRFVQKEWGCLALAAVSYLFDSRDTDELHQHSELIPLDKPVFLWYSSFWVQLQLIPGSRLCPSPLRKMCTILVQRKYL